MCWGTGILISSAVVRAVAGIEGNLGWQLPFLLQWIWPVPLFIGAWFAPESPWNAVRRGKLEEAKQSLLRLSAESESKERDAEAALAYIRHTTEIEKAETEGASFWQCFQGTNLRRTEIVSMPIGQHYFGKADKTTELCRLGSADSQRQRHSWLRDRFSPGSWLL